VRYPSDGGFTLPWLRTGLTVVSAAEVLFEPDIQADKQVPAAHFLDLQLGLP